MNVRLFRSPVEQIVCLFLALVSPAFAQSNGTALVNHAPTLNGTVEGSIQLLQPEDVTLNGGAAIAGDLLVRGTPTVRLNGRPNYGGTVEGSGAASPTNYTVTLNGNARLRHVVRRTDPLSLSRVAAPSQPTGNRSVSLDRAGQSVGDFSTVRNLTLNGNVGTIAVPAGVYGNFIANGGSGFVLGTPGAKIPSSYAFQNLTLNGNSTFTVVGPVVVVVNGGFSTNASMGAPSHPEWLALRIAGGGLSLNGNVSVYARVQAPAGTITLNGNSRLIGAVESDRLIVNGNSLLRLLEPTPNQPPTATLALSPDQASFLAPASFTLTATAADTDGAIAKVEFFQGTNKLGEDTIAPFAIAVSGLTAGTYSYTARATDDLGAAADSPAVAITVTAPNQPPMISLAAPPDGALYTAPAAFSLSATASDPDGTIAKVEFFQDATKLGETFSAPFDFAVSSLAPGTYAFTARAFDNAGATATSAASTITVVAPNQPPSVNLSAPADGSTYVAPATVTLVAAATDSDGTVVKVEFFEGFTKLGEALAAPFQLSVAQLGVGSHTFLARAYDNCGASVDSTPITIEVTSPNQLPTVELTSPDDGAVFATPAATVTLAATAADADGTIAKVEFYQADVKLGEASNAPYTFVWNNVAPGSYAVTARAYDNAGAFTVSAARSVIVQVGLPYFTGFETGDGFALGGLAGQAGWAVTGDASVTESLSGAGQRSVLLTASQPAAQVAHRFPPYTGQTVVFLDLLARPVASATPTQVLETDTARVGFLRSGTTGALQVFNANGAGGGAWEPTTAAAGLLDNGQAANWIRLTLREDFAAKRWDLYANGQLVAHDLGFLDNSKSLFGQFSFTGGESAPSAFDEFYAGFDNPLFADADHDGMDDAWESAHGLNPAVDDRTGDLDGDGLSNIREYLNGTEPTKADTDGDGLSDYWEVTHHLNPREAAAPDDDTDHDGLTDLAEYAAGTDPNRADTDGDGLVDGMEVELGLDPLRPEPQSLMDSDADGDGLTFRQELQLGTDPNTAQTGEMADVDGDGLPNAWEIAHGLDPLRAEDVESLDTDADGDGLTLREEAQAGTDPTKADTDGDGLPDGYEVRMKLNPLRADASLDTDGDGLSNAEEARRGSDPNDYYNGSVPTLVPLFDDGELGPNGLLAVRILSSDGKPLPNAPITLEVTDGEQVVALTPDGPPVGRSALTRSDAAGIARVYVRTL